MKRNLFLAMLFGAASLLLCESVTTAQSPSGGQGNLRQEGQRQLRGFGERNGYQGQPRSGHERRGVGQLGGRPGAGQRGAGQRGGGQAQASRGGGPRDRVRPRDIEFNEKFPLGTELPADLKIYNVDRQLVPVSSLLQNDYTVIVGGVFNVCGVSKLFS